MSVRSAMRPVSIDGTSNVGTCSPFADLDEVSIPVEDVLPHIESFRPCRRTIKSATHRFASGNSRTVDVGGETPHVAAICPGARGRGSCRTRRPLNWTGPVPQAWLGPILAVGLPGRHLARVVNETKRRPPLHCSTTRIHLTLQGTALGPDSPPTISQSTANRRVH